MSRRTRLQSLLTRIVSFPIEGGCFFPGTPASSTNKNWPPRNNPKEAFRDGVKTPTIDQSSMINLPVIT